ncbi:MAG: hypothetical protein JRI68_16550 [Deltaproteobacteria bacterium]|nr:hypothetical protein [Deltaproteobacteria bacterium]
MRLSMASTVGLTVICLILGSFLTSINEIWSWLSMGLFGGMAMPMVLRWYWERFNGWGYTWGTVAGVVGAMVQKVVAPDLAEWAQLAVTASVSLAGCLIGTWATSPTAKETVVEFYRRTRPMGAWPRARQGLSADERSSIRKENARDTFSIIPAMGLFFFLFLAPMYALTRDWNMTLVAVVISLVCGVVLYFSWFRHLGGTPAPDEADKST